MILRWRSTANAGDSEQAPMIIQHTPTLSPGIWDENQVRLVLFTSVAVSRLNYYNFLLFRIDARRQFGMRWQWAAQRLTVTFQEKREFFASLLQEKIVSLKESHTIAWHQLHERPGWWSCIWELIADSLHIYLTVLPKTWQLRDSLNMWLRRSDIKSPCILPPPYMTTSCS